MITVVTLQNMHIKKIDYDIKQFIYNHFRSDLEAFKKKLLIKRNEYLFYWCNVNDIDFVLKYAHRIKVKRWLFSSISIL